jgi:hypothetical protein
MAVRHRQWYERSTGVQHELGTWRLPMGGLNLGEER